MHQQLSQVLASSDVPERKEIICVTLLCKQLRGQGAGVGALQGHRSHVPVWDFPSVVSPGNKTSLSDRLGLQWGGGGGGGAAR